MANYPNSKIVFYEDLCENPILEFKKLFNFAGLNWNSNIEKLIESNSRNYKKNMRKEAYTTRRNSKEMPYNWKGKITKLNMKTLKYYYMCQGKNYYF